VVPGPPEDTKAESMAVDRNGSTRASSGDRPAVHAVVVPGPPEDTKASIAARQRGNVRSDSGLFDWRRLDEVVDERVGSGTSLGLISPHSPDGSAPMPSTARHVDFLGKEPTPKAYRRISNAKEDSDKVLQKAFVVNFRRLLDVHQVFTMLHELIKSTAIAALTLVLAQDIWQLGYSIIFVGILLTLYVFHWSHYDTMNIDDYKKKADLIEDDNGEYDGRTISNPNRYLKALALSPNRRRWRTVLVLMGFGIFCVFLWCLVFVQWADGELKWIAAGFMRDELYATLLLVGTLMFTFIAFFEWLYWRETSCVMPWVPGKPGEPTMVPFNAAIHTVPHRYRWFGLPSLWFSSADGWDDLGTWISKSQNLGDHRAERKPFPLEMAVFALDAGSGCHLRNTLRHAKVYNATDKEFLFKEGKGRSMSWRSVGNGEEPTELELELVLFDNQHAQYLQPEESYDEGRMHMLQQRSRSRLVCSRTDL